MISFLAVLSFCVAVEDDEFPTDIPQGGGGGAHLIGKTGMYPAVEMICKYIGCSSVRLTPISPSPPLFSSFLFPSSPPPPPPQGSIPAPTLSVNSRCNIHTHHCQLQGHLTSCPQGLQPLVIYPGEQRSPTLPQGVGVISLMQHPWTHSWHFGLPDLEQREGQIGTTMALKGRKVHSGITFHCPGK